jgi:hypothetical protein
MEENIVMGFSTMELNYSFDKRNILSLRGSLVVLR